MSEWILSSSVLILLMLVIRSVFQKKLELRVRYALWMIVAVRLLVPVSFAESNLSILNLIESERSEGAGATDFTQNGNNFGILSGNVNLGQNEVGDSFSVDGAGNYPGINNAVADDIKYPMGGTVQPNPGETIAGPGFEGTDALQNVSGVDNRFLSEQNGQLEESKLQANFFEQYGIILFSVWAVGVAFWSLLLLGVNCNFIRRVHNDRKSFAYTGESVLPIYISNAVKTPCMFGLFRPAIYLTPQAVEDKTALKYILCHENTHYRHRDNWWSTMSCAP